MRVNQNHRLTYRKYGFMVNCMKTTLEVPDGLYRQIKARAALKGQTIRAFFLDAIQAKLASERTGPKKTTGWRTAFGTVPKDEIAELQKFLDDEYSQVNPEDWQ